MPEANVTRQRVGELMYSLVKMLSTKPEGLQAKDAVASLKSLVPPTPYEAAEYKSGGERYNKIVRFATIDLVKAGWLSKAAGIWTVTDSGREALDQHLNPTEFYVESTRLYREWRAQNPREEVIEDVGGAFDVDSEDAANEVLLDEVKESADQAIFAYLAKMNPYDFQALVAELLRGMGHYVDFEAKPGRDGGLDIVAYSHALGTDGLPRVKVQVKARESQKADAKELREFNSLLHGTDVGVFVSLAGFTSDAEREARSMHDKRIVLVDFGRLMTLWIENYDKLPESGRRLLPLTTIHHLDLRS